MKESISLISSLILSIYVPPNSKITNIKNKNKKN